MINPTSINLPLYTLRIYFNMLYVMIYLRLWSKDNDLKWLSSLSHHHETKSLVEAHEHKKRKTIDTIDNLADPDGVRTPASVP